MAPLKYHVLFLVLLLGGAKVHNQEKKFFMDNTVQALISSKGRHGGLLKLRIQLGDRISV